MRTGAVFAAALAAFCCSCSSRLSARVMLDCLGAFHCAASPASSAHTNDRLSAAEDPCKVLVDMNPCQTGACSPNRARQHRLDVVSTRMFDVVTGNHKKKRRGSFQGFRLSQR